MAESRTITATLPVNIFNTVEAIATERKRERNDILKEALEMYIDEWGEYITAFDRINDPSDDVLTESEFLEELKEDYGWKL